MVDGTILFEIIRDVWQSISLILFEIHEQLSWFKTFSFNGISYLTSFCFSCYLENEVIKTTAYQWMFIIQSIFALCAVIAFRCAAYIDIKYDKEDIWTPQMKAKKRKIIYVSTVILTTLYLPLVRDVCKVLFCDSSLVGSTFIPQLDIITCYMDIHWLFIFIAVFILFVYILWVPWLLYKVIQHKKPKPIYFDATGEYGAFTNADYRREVNKDSKNPYRSLFSGYERKYAHYKVITMIFKLFLTIPAVIIVTENQIDFGTLTEYHIAVIRNGVIVLILVLFATQSICAKPYIDPFNNRMDCNTRVMAIILGVIAMVFVILEPTDALQSILSAFVAVLNGILFIVTLYAFARGNKWMRKKYKKYSQTLTFERDIDTNEALILYHYKDKLNFSKQRKIRIWYKFWDDLFQKDVELRIPPNKEKATKKVEKEYKKKQMHDDYKESLVDAKEEEQALIDAEYEPKHLEISYAGYTSPYLMNFEYTVGERHGENKAIVYNVGIASYKIYIDQLVEQLQNNGNIQETFTKISTVLQGKDVFWNGSAAFVEKKQSGDQLANINMVKSQSLTHFGTLSLSPFPFLAKLEFDEGEIAIFSLSPVVASRKNVDYLRMMSHLSNLVKQNENEEVRRRKNIRLRFRAMHGSQCRWRIQKYKGKQISRTVTYEEYNSSTGQYETRRRTEDLIVRVLFTFNIATLILKQKRFLITLEYKDGFGSYYKENWGNYSWENEYYSLPQNEIGINYSYEQTPTLMQFFAANFDPHIDHYRNNMKNITNHWLNQRRDKCNEYIAKEKVLSYAFWYYVYNDDTISFEFVECALKSELNTKMKGLADEYIAYFVILYDVYYAFFNASYENALWFLFWNDVWTNNKDVKAIKDNPQLFDTNLFYQTKLRNEEEKEQNVECIALNKKTKTELVNILMDLKLHAGKGCLIKGWFNMNIIDALYQAMDEVKTWNINNSDDDDDDVKYESNDEKDETLYCKSDCEQLLGSKATSNDSGGIHNDECEQRNLNEEPKCSLQEFQQKYHFACRLMYSIFKCN